MVKDSSSRKIKIIRIEDKKRLSITDLTAREVELTILINNHKLISLNCSPGNYQFLAVGFLYTNTIITGRDDIISIKTGKNSVNITLNNIVMPVEKKINFHLPMGVLKLRTEVESESNKLYSNKKKMIIKSDTIFTLLSHLQEKAHLFDRTGGVHSCALADGKGSLLLFCEDISRYNTVDRILGEALLKNINLADKILLTSCRITRGILEKIINGKVSTVISRSAVTDNAIKLAKEALITLVGFARGNRMNIYSFPEDIIN